MKIKNPYLGPDTSSMTMKEIIELRETRKRYTRALDSDKLFFTETNNKADYCNSCGHTPYWTIPFTDKFGEDHPSRLMPIKLYPIDGVRLCSKCFRAYWCELPETPSSNTGVPVSSIPRSQREYDGGTFHAGEW